MLPSAFWMILALSSSALLILPVPFLASFSALAISDFMILVR